MVVPPLSALLADPSWEMIGYLGPEVRAIDVHQMQQEPVLDICPRPFDEGGIQHFLPAMQALHISAILELLSNFLPVFRLNRIKE